MLFCPWVLSTLTAFKLRVKLVCTFSNVSWTLTTRGWSPSPYSSFQAAAPTPTINPSVALLPSCSATLQACFNCSLHPSSRRLPVIMRYSEAACDPLTAFLRSLITTHSLFWLSGWKTGPAGHAQDVWTPCTRTNAHKIMHIGTCIVHIYCEYLHTRTVCENTAHPTAFMQFVDQFQSPWGEVELRLDI